MFANYRFSFMRGVLCSLWVTLRCFTTPPRAWRWRWGVARCSPQNFTRSRTDRRQHGSADASGQNMMLMLNTARSQGQDTTQNFTQRRWQCFPPDDTQHKVLCHAPEYGGGQIQYFSHSKRMQCMHSDWVSQRCLPTPKKHSAKGSQYFSLKRMHIHWVSRRCFPTP